MTTTDIEAVLGEATVARLHRAIGDRTDAVVAVATPDGCILWASEPGSAAIFGRQQGDFAGRTQFDYLHPEDHAIFRANLARAARGGTVRCRVRAMTADGSWLHVAGVAWGVGSGDDRLIVWITVPADADLPLDDGLPG